VDLSHGPSTKEYTFPKGTGTDDEDDDDDWPSIPTTAPTTRVEIVDNTPQSKEWTIHRAVSALEAMSGRLCNLQTQEDDESSSLLPSNDNDDDVAAWTISMGCGVGYKAIVNSIVTITTTTTAIGFDPCEEKENRGVIVVQNESQCPFSVV
jgi:hypothetical protein